MLNEVRALDKVRRRQHLKVKRFNRKQGRQLHPFIQE
tara:strand:- start:747 stop:857 length:111 start_codon:yes stop_codon:yes gene_type:complete